MKKLIILASIAPMFFMAHLAFAAESMIFDSTNNYLGGCQLTNKSEWELTKDLEVTKFQIWYSWNQGETTLPVTVFKDGKEFAKFEATRGDCDPYQKQWCNADYAINKKFPKGKYFTEIKEARQCLKPGSTGTVRLYGTEAATTTTKETATTTTTESTTNCAKSCTTPIVVTAVITLVVSFAAFYFIFKKK